MPSCQHKSVITFLAVWSGTPQEPQHGECITHADTHTPLPYK